MPWLIAFAAFALAGIGAGLYFLTRSRRANAEEHELELALFMQVAEQVGGLTLSQTPDGRPRLRGNVAGIEIEIDRDNHFDRGFDARLGMRAAVPWARSAPEAMIVAGNVPSLLVERFGDARPLGLGDASLLALHTRADRDGPAWWLHPELASILLELRGVALILADGQLTVLFDDLEDDNVRSALRVPPLLRDAVARPTVH